MLGAGSAPCPMDAMDNMVFMVAEPQEDTASTPADCCNDLETYLQTGEACKTGLQCGPSAGTPWVFTSPVPVSFNQTQRPPSLLTQMRGEAPPSIWRPPANL